MGKKQWLVILCGVAVVAVLYAFGKRTSQAGTAPAVEMANNGAPKVDRAVAAASFDDILQKAKSALSPDMQMQISKLENSVTRGDVKTQQLHAYHELATVWDSLGNRSIAAHYKGEQGKLENSEKTMTFAANLFLIQQQQTVEPAVKQWEIAEAEDLLNRAEKLAPQNDSVQVGLAQIEVAKGAVMQGVQRLMKIVERNPDDIAANMVLGRLSIQSGQYAKAVERLQKVVNQQPRNVEALYYLAEAYKETGKKDKAIELFHKCKLLVNDPGFSKEIDDYIKTFE